LPGLVENRTHAGGAYVKRRLGLPVSALLLIGLAQAVAQEQPQPPVASPSPRPAEPRQGPSFAADVEQVTVDVVVTDKKGNPSRRSARPTSRSSTRGSRRN
jgi:hypothetical protein